MHPILDAAEQTLQAAIERKRRGGENRWCPLKGEEIQYLRKSLSLTQTAFAQEYGFELASLRNWEQDRNIPDASARQLLWMIVADPNKAKELVLTAKQLSLV